MLKLAALVLLITVITVVVIYLNIVSSSKKSIPVKSDVMIVLGCQIWDRSPSWSLKYRLEKAFELYNSGYAGYIIVSGGQGKDETTTESSVMKEWLVSRGIEESRIFEEDRSTSTLENLKYSGEIMKQHGMKTALIVSSDFHIFRSLIIAERLGISAAGAPAPTVEHLKGYYRFREVISVIKSFVLDR
jgi:uncharacterized SAM-binding protein YcdF (DUF218 family)